MCDDRVSAGSRVRQPRLCGCGQSAADADEHIDTARLAVAAVLETLAERSAVMEQAHDGWGVFDADELRGLAAEVKTGEDR